MVMIDMENYEEYLLLYIDEELDADTAVAFLQFVKEHPEVEEELNSYQHVRLVPNEALVFEGKESLLKEDKTRRLVPLWSYGVAAGVALIVFCGIYVGLRDEARVDTSSGRISRVNTVPAGAPAKVQPTAQTSAVPAPPSHHTQQIVAATKPVSTGSAKPADKEPRSINSTREAMVAAIDVTAVSLRSVSSAATTAKGIDKELPIPSIETANLAAVEKETLADRLGLEGEKKQAINDIKDQLSETVSLIQHLPKNLKETTVSLRLGHKELVSINL